MTLSVSSRILSIDQVTEWYRKVRIYRVPQSYSIFQVVQWISMCTFYKLYARYLCFIIQACSRTDNVESQNVCCSDRRQYLHTTKLQRLIFGTHSTLCTIITQSLTYKAHVTIVSYRHTLVSLHACTSPIKPKRNNWPTRWLLRDTDYTNVVRNAFTKIKISHNKGRDE